MRKIASTVLILTTIVALGACGGSSKNNAASSGSPNSSSSSSSSSASSGTGDKGDFCKTIVSNQPDQVGDDPNGAKQVLALVKSLTPPDEIKGDWDEYVGALEELSNADPNDQGKLASVAAAHAKAISNVSLYISKSCLDFNSDKLSSLSDSLSSLSDSSGN